MMPLGFDKYVPEILDGAGLGPSPENPTTLNQAIEEGKT